MLQFHPPFSCFIPVRFEHSLCTTLLTNISSWRKKQIIWFSFDSPCIGVLSRFTNLTHVTAFSTMTALFAAMRVGGSSVSRLSSVVASSVVTVVFTTFAAPFCIADGRIRLPRRFLTLSGHFLEISRLPTGAALALRNRHVDLS